MLTCARGTKLKTQRLDYGPCRTLKCVIERQCILINTKKDGLSVTLVKQILRYLQNCETDKLQFENKVEKAKVRPLAEQLQNAKKDKGRLLNENNLLLQQVANFALQGPHL